ncbi:hypothetical protein ACWEIJ_30225 [Lentzea sp. NPDC004789]
MINRYGHTYQWIVNDFGDCLDVSGNGLTKGLQLPQYGCIVGGGGAVVQWLCNGHDDQYWIAY